VKREMFMEYIKPSMEFFIIDGEEDIITTSTGTTPGLDIDEGQTDTGDFGDL